MKTVLLTLEENLHQKLKELSKEKKIPMRELIRKAISFLIEVEKNADR